MKISLIIPCFNSEYTLRKVVSDAREALASRTEVNYEIILVNDGSTDGTYEVIEDLCKDPRVKGVNLSRNFGQANATLAGMASASGDLIVYSDDDGQTPISQVWDLIDRLSDRFDGVFARYVERKGTPLQIAGSKLNNLMAFLMMGKPEGLQMGNFWVLRRFVVDEVVKTKGIYPYIGGLILRVTLSLTDVVSVHGKRESGKSNYTFSKMLSLWLNGFTSFSVLPLRVLLALGGIIGTFGFVFTVIAIIGWLVQPETVPGYTSLISAVLLFGGLNLSMLGLVGEYVGRTLMTVSGLPQYVVKERINLPK